MACIRSFRVISRKKLIFRRLQVLHGHLQHLVKLLLLLCRQAMEQAAASLDAVAHRIDPVRQPACVGDTTW